MQFSPREIRDHCGRLGNMKKHLFLVLALAAVLGGCRTNAESFFTGRPSEMSQIHNRIIAGGPMAVKELLTIPARFPDAKASHIKDWQYSISSWWTDPEKRQWIINLLPQLTGTEQQFLRQWLKTRDDDLPQINAYALDEILAVISHGSLR